MQEKLKFKFVISYDGTNYAGWQVQKTGTGVQEKIEAALQKLFQVDIRLHSSSRTDTGVHALGMAAHCEIPAARFKMPDEKLLLAINAHLPGDIRIASATRCASTFHARFDAQGKQYRYQVWNHAALNPLLRHQAWHVPQPLDMAAMRKAASLFVGTRDFKSFAANRNYEMETTIRTVHRCQIRRSGPLITFVIEGDGFLYKMCRGMVGTLVQIGQGKLAVAAVGRIFASKDRRAAGMTAPALGLILWKVYYRRKGPRAKREERP